jgi:2-polyprenyl-6-methoxyphenol hydroxylase-like FAD-dependent oxidoreductase
MTTPSLPAAVHEPPRATALRHETDVLVVGGGSAGVAAAVAAARAGARTLLVERSGSLGGLASSGLILLLLTLDDGRGRQVVGGICQEVVDRLAARDAAWFPAKEEWGSTNAALVAREQRRGLVWGRAPHVVRYSVAYDAEEMKFALAELVREAGVELLLHALGCDPWLEDGRVAGVFFESKAGRFAIRARSVIDASGDGDLFARLGCAHERERVLPWQWFVLGGIADADEAALRGRGFRTLGDGRLLMPWGATEKIARAIDATSPEDLTYAELECRRRVMAEIDRLRAEDPAFARAHVCRIADALGITESRRLVGRRVLTREEMDRVVDDGVALTGHWTQYGALYSIPYGCLLARELPNLLVAGRCISVDHRVHHATKEIPACFATGEAAGAAAALALGAGVEPAELDVQRLREHLLGVGAILA